MKQLHNDSWFIPSVFRECVVLEDGIVQKNQNEFFGSLNFQNFFNDSNNIWKINGHIFLLSHSELIELNWTLLMGSSHCYRGHLLLLRAHQKLRAFEVDTWAPSLGQEDPLEEEIATHSIILAWRIPWTEEPGWAMVRVVAQNWTHLSEFILLNSCAFFFLTIAFY